MIFERYIEPDVIYRASSNTAAYLLAKSKLPKNSIRLDDLIGFEYWVSPELYQELFGTPGEFDEFGFSGS